MADRIIVFDGVYDKFREMLVEATGRLKVGTTDTDDYGPVINEEQMKNMLTSPISIIKSQAYNTTEALKA